jgi:hypothetical protein
MFFLCNKFEVLYNLAQIGSRIISLELTNN